MPPRRRATAPEIPFDRSLVLFQYILSLFGKDSLESLCEEMQNDMWEGLDDNNISNYHNYLTYSFASVQRPKLPDELLLQYDQNIVSHTLRIAEKRDVFKWKYFQYMALLFTEIYLDKYFSSNQSFLNELNGFLELFNHSRPESSKLEPYTQDDLNKVAVWQATGSGKTLLMHVNILQYHHYLNKHGRENELNKTILLTPNEGLSEQHKKELLLAGFDADLFNKNATADIEIIDIHKLREEEKDKTVSVDSFEDNNLVLVDEGHRGASGTEWMDKRNRLCESGFSFEYSATFGQAVKGKRELTQLYAKCILFDYSYKYFYADGYGKEYSILNLSDDQYEDQRQLYLTACLLMYYQQLKLFLDQERAFSAFNLEEPLWIFVGSKVTSVRKERGENVSDVVDILLFLNRFLHAKEESVDFIYRLLNGHSQLNDTHGKDLFAGRFDYLINTGQEPNAIFYDILKIMFNSEIPNAQLYLDNLKGVQGEIGLRLGDSDYFGVINVGDDRDLLKLCEANQLMLGDRDFSDSLFTKINDKGSRVKILIGSKKFSEGWNSWRVSTMGLMNVGRSEGSEIIQLFGRGVRLKGHDMSLKRSSRLNGVSIPRYIDHAETLNVFGVKADYMATFREFLELEGVKNKDDYEEIHLPVIKDIDSRKLKYPQLKEGVDFKKQGSRPTLGLPDDYMLERPVKIDWYPKIEAIQARGVRPGAAATLNQSVLRKEHIAFLNMERIYFELQKYKNERCYYNLNIPRYIISALLERHDWYNLFIPEEDMQFHSFAQVAMWQEIAVTLLKKYCDQYFNMMKLDFEKDKMEYKYLDDVEAALAAKGKAGNLFDDYTVLVDRSREDIINKILQLKEKIEKKDLTDFKYDRFIAFSFSRHLYKPLIHITKDSQIKISPVALNEGEKDFVCDFRKFYEQDSSFFAEKEIYLLRNLGRGRGVGFFQAHGFHPDFILWIIKGTKQYVSFIDPHGCRHARGFDDPKIRFHKEIKVMEKQIGDPDVILNSFIISVTGYQQINWWEPDISQKAFEDNNVFFQESGTTGYIKKIFIKIERN